MRRLAKRCAAPAVLGLAFVLTGCTRADQYVVVVNDCTEPIIVDDHGYYGAVTVPAGKAVDFTFDAEPPLTVDVAGARTVPAELREWPETIRAGVAAVIAVTPAFCNKTSLTLELTLDDAHVVEDRYVDRLVGG